jgi:hypothetical protein
LRWPALVIVVLGVAALLFWPAADFLAAHDASGLTGRQREQETAKARDAARGRLVQFATVMLGVGAYIFTVRNFQLALEQAHRQAEATIRTLEQNEAAQITDRFARAIEILGSDAIDVRLGACGVWKLGLVTLTCGSVARAWSGSGHPRCLCLGLCCTSCSIESSNLWCCSGAVTVRRRSRLSRFGTRSPYCAVTSTGLT